MGPCREELAGISFEEATSQASPHGPHLGAVDDELTAYIDASIVPPDTLESSEEASHSHYYHIWTYKPRFYSSRQSHRRRHHTPIITIYGHISLDSTPLGRVIGGGITLRLQHD
jgi:hypothetical protein